MMTCVDNYNISHIQQIAKKIVYKPKLCRLHGTLIDFKHK